MSWTRWHLVVHDWTGRDWAELLRIARLCTALHSTGLHLTAIDLYGPGVRWIEMYLAGRELIGIGIGRVQIPPNGLDRASVEWTGLD